MSGARENAALIGAGATACAVCCAGPILGLVAALGIGALAGALVFGVVAFAVAMSIGTVLVVRRKRRQTDCAKPRVEVPVAMSAAQSRDM